MKDTDHVKKAWSQMYSMDNAYTTLQLIRSQATVTLTAGVGAFITQSQIKSQKKVKPLS